MSNSSSGIPRSPLDEIEGLIYLPRLCEKVRMMDAGNLDSGYHANLGLGMDLWTCQFLGVDYSDLTAQVKLGKTDKECLEWAREHGVEREDYELAWWKSYMMNRGFRDDLAERLKERIEESGFWEKGILSFMDYIEEDEGRRSFSP